MEILTQIGKYIDVYYLVAFMAITYSLKSFVVESLTYLFKSKVSPHIGVFLIGSLVALPFWLYFGHDKLTLLMTYAVGTSIHDLLIKFLIKKVKVLFKENQ